MPLPASQPQPPPLTTPTHPPSPRRPPRSVRRCCTHHEGGQCGAVWGKTGEGACRASGGGDPNAGCLVLNYFFSFNVQYNLLTAIDHDSFRGFHALRELFLSHNRLTSILPGTVDTLVHLQIFSLANNQLTAIPSVLLWDCTALTAFDVRFNRIARCSWRWLDFDRLGTT